MPPKLRVEMAREITLKSQSPKHYQIQLFHQLVILESIIIKNAAASFRLSFIIDTKGELEPRSRELPRLAINTIENLARISLMRIALNKSNPVVKEIVIINPIKYNTIATIPAEPVVKIFHCRVFYPYFLLPSNHLQNQPSHQHDEFQLRLLLMQQPVD